MRVFLCDLKICPLKAALPFNELQKLEMIVAFGLT